MSEIANEGVRPIKELLDELQRPFLKEPGDKMSFDEACSYLKLSHYELDNLTSHFHLYHHSDSNWQTFYYKNELDKWVLENQKVLRHLKSNIEKKRKRWNKMLRYINSE